jgi:hypothetical protein
MHSQKPEFQEISIILIGDFNPHIFQPAWFAEQNLIRQQEAEMSDIDFINRDIVSFSLDWMHLQVNKKQFFVGTTQQPYDEVLRDLVIGTFRLLNQTPIDVMGINSERHFSIKSEEQWPNFEHRLAPKRLWNEVLESPSLQSLTMESQHPDGRHGFIRAQVEPSVKIQPGIRFNINHHYQVKKTGNILSSEELIDILEHCWNSSLARSNKIVYHLLESI